MAKSIFFVGQPYNEAVKVLKNAGYRVGGFLDQSYDLSTKDSAMYDQIITADFTSEENLIDSLKEKKFQVDGLICTYENYVLAKSWLGKYLGLNAPSVESARLCTDKSLMRKAFQEYDDTITPLYRAVADKQELLDFANKVGYPLIIKPTNLVKSLLVMRCDDEKELIKNYDYATATIEDLYRKYKIYDRTPQMIVEQYIVGKTCSIAAFVDANGDPHYCDGIVSLINAQDINISDNFIYARTLPGDLPGGLESKLFAVAEKGIRALKMTSTPAHVELIYTNNEVKIIEIGARIGGYRPRMYDFSYGIDMINSEASLALGEGLDLRGEFKQYCAVFEIFPTKEGIFEGVSGAAQPRDYFSYKVKAKIGSRVGPAKNGYKATVIIIVVNDNKDQFESICATVANIKVLTE